jgi:hypothetical protein
MNLNHVLKKVGRGISHDLFSNWYFRNLQVSSFVYSILEVSFYLELIIIIIIKSIKCNFYFGNVLRCSAVSFAFRTSTLVLELHSLALWCLNPWLGIFLMVGGCRFPLSEDLVVLLTSRSHWKKSLGYPKLVSICWFTDFWVNKSLSMMCPPHYRFVFSPLAKKKSSSYLSSDNSMLSSSTIDYWVKQNEQTFYTLGNPNQWKTVLSTSDVRGVICILTKTKSK